MIATGDETVAMMLAAEAGEIDEVTFVEWVGTRVVCMNDNEPSERCRAWERLPVAGSTRRC